MCLIEFAHHCEAFDAVLPPGTKICFWALDKKMNLAYDTSTLETWDRGRSLCGRGWSLTAVRPAWRVVWVGSLEISLTGAVFLALCLRVGTEFSPFPESWAGKSEYPWSLGFITRFASSIFVFSPSELTFASGSSSLDSRELWLLCMFSSASRFSSGTLGNFEATDWRFG